MFRKFQVLLTLLFVSLGSALAQQSYLSAKDIQLGLQKLNTLGSVLYFAAHPDDENTRLIAWLAQEKKYRTSYLSLTRGDGGQNLIGTEIGINLGLIRTQELLAARQIDKGEQLFSSAYDFGFSKTATETFEFWDKETALREAVWIIRKFRPDIIITRFPPDSRGGHGHHQASAILAHEAFIAAADPNKYPEQLKEVSPWKAKRLIWNTFNFGGANTIAEDQLKIDIGAYNPILGSSYGEIAAESRSQHKSQGFGAAATRGRGFEYFEHVAGDKATITLMDGVNTTWERIPNTQTIQAIIKKLNQNFDALQPQKLIKDLFTLRQEISKIKDTYWKEQKTKEVEQLIVACAGLWTDAITTAPNYAVNQNYPIQVEAIVRNADIPAKITKLGSKTVHQALPHNVLYKTTYVTSWPISTQPYWLQRPHTLGKFDITTSEIGHPTNPIRPSIDITFEIFGHNLTLTKDVQYRHVDPVQGEVYSPLVIKPALTAHSNSTHLLSINGEQKSIEITFQRNDSSINNATVVLSEINGWEITPSKIQLNFDQSNSSTHTIQVKPLSKNSNKGLLSFHWNQQALSSEVNINYTHIPSLTWFPILQISCQQVDLQHQLKKIGYIAGAGDLVAEALNQIGIETILLQEKNITAAQLKAYDAVIVGVRHYNINQQADKVAKELEQYVQDGGTVLVQYHVNSKLFTNNLGPYPFTLTRTRVTEEKAIVTFDSNDLSMNFPNKITNADFDNWVQERGLYFADNIDTRYRTPLLMNDQQEAASNGSLLIAKHGKGKFVYTSLSFFRQLPAGVPGAYRLFVNLLSKEQ